MTRRRDEVWFSRMLSYNNALKFSLVVCLVLIMLLMAFVYGLWRKGREVYVFDSTTGRTYGVRARLGQGEIDLQMQVRSEAFITDFLNHDHTSIEKARFEAYSRMSPRLRARYGKDLGNPETIKKAIAEKTVSDLTFETPTRIIERAHPSYRTFIHVKRKVTSASGRFFEDEFYYTLDLLKRNPTREFPDGIFVTGVREIGDEKTLSEILNQIQ